MSGECSGQCHVPRNARDTWPYLTGKSREIRDREDGCIYLSRDGRGVIEHQSARDGGVAETSQRDGGGVLKAGHRDGGGAINHAIDHSAIDGLATLTSRHPRTAD